MQINSHSPFKESWSGDVRAHRGGRERLIDVHWVESGDAALAVRAVHWLLVARALRKTTH